MGFTHGMRLLIASARAFATRVAASRTAPSPMPAPPDPGASRRPPARPSAARAESPSPPGAPAGWRRHCRRAGGDTPRASPRDRPGIYGAAGIRRAVTPLGPPACMESPVAVSGSMPLLRPKGVSFRCRPTAFNPKPSPDTAPPRPRSFRRPVQARSG
jgi:hypothetical protein